MALLRRIFTKPNLQTPVFNSIRCLTNQTQNIVNTPKFIPIFTSFTNPDNPWMYQERDRIEAPKPIKPFDLPHRSLIIPLSDEPSSKNEIIAPGVDSYEKLAVRMIIIRKRKMRVHKLKKLRKKMRYEWAKIRQKRELKKEKAFQAELMAQIKEAREFSAEQYVAEKIRQAKEVPIPRFWKGKRLPEFIIRQKLGLPPKQ